MSDTEAILARVKEARAVNVAAKALGLGLAGMTQERWQALSQRERDEMQDLSGLTKQLMLYEGCRVEMVDIFGLTRRFWVSRSSGWRPCHIELKRINSSGGVSADDSYQSVIFIRKAKDYNPWRGS